jgi:PHD/YefM family antitoxin component YafN of YafNO toxin-antitoxin module
LTFVHSHGALNVQNIVQQADEQSMIRSTDITSFTEYRQKLREHHDRLKKTSRPLYITTNGETDAVVLSPELFDDLADRAELPEILAMIARSETDLEAGRAAPVSDVRTQLADRHGIQRDQ